LTENFVVAVGANASSSNTISIVYSYNGSTWKDVSDSNLNNGQGRGIAWNGSLWVVAGLWATKTIVYSSDGIIWNSASTNPFSGVGPAAGGFGNTVAWNGSLWLAGGRNGDNSVVLASSPDGDTWTPITGTPFDGTYVKGVAWNGSMWVAAGGNGVMYSYNTITWTGPSNPLDGEGAGIAWNGKMWVAVGFNGDNSVAFATSSNGIVWTPVTSNPFSGGQGNGVAWNGTYWVAVGNNGTNTVTIAISSNGTTWTPASNNPFSGGQGNNVIWNGSQWIAVGNNSNASVTIATSPDGMNWTQSSTNPFSGGGFLNPGVGNAVASRRVLPYVGTSSTEYIARTASNWVSPPPTTFAAAIDRIAAALALVNNKP
jgi:hypothetical protein